MKTASILNLLTPLPAASTDEHFQTLLARPGVRLERIVSDGQISPPGFWYAQDDDEWIIVLKGEGTVEYEDGQQFALTAGDSLLIPAHCRHRVAYTAVRTVWLALFCPAQADV